MKKLYEQLADERFLFLFQRRANAVAPKRPTTNGEGSGMQYIVESPSKLGGITVPPPKVTETGLEKQKIEE